MERTNCLKLSVNPILSLEDLGLDRSASMDEASRGLARISEAQIARSIQFPAVCPPPVHFAVAPCGAARAYGRGSVARCNPPAKL